MREVLTALDWVRGEMMRRGSPDFIRQREAEGRVRELCEKLVSGNLPSSFLDSRRKLG